MVKIVTVDSDEGTFLEYRSQALNAFFADGIVDLRAIFSDRSTIAISWVFGIAEELQRHSNGRIIHCDAAAYVTGYGDVHLVLDRSFDPVILPAITPAEHFRVIVHPLASGQPYDSYLLECWVSVSYVKFKGHVLSNISNPCSSCPLQEAFHNHRVFGITGMGTNNQPAGIYYCIRIADELKRSENAIIIVSSGWIFGPRQYALDIVLMHRDTKKAELVPGWSRNCFQQLELSLSMQASEVGSTSMASDKAFRVGILSAR